MKINLLFFAIFISVGLILLILSFAQKEHFPVGTELGYNTSKVTTSVETNVSVEKYSKYTLTTNEYYMVVTKIDTTLIFAKVSKNYKNNVNDTLEKLGY